MFFLLFFCLFLCFCVIFRVCSSFYELFVVQAKIEAG